MNGTPYDSWTEKLFQVGVGLTGAELTGVSPGSLGCELPSADGSTGRDSRKRAYPAFVMQVGGGSIQFCEPNFHEFPERDRLSPQQQKSIQGKGGAWPPPSQGMLCFAEFHLEADGDQVLWDVSQGLRDGEYPIFYYAHESNPPCVRKLADGFESWLGNCLSYFDDDDSGL